jgi:hypothetical protein
MEYRKRLGGGTFTGLKMGVNKLAKVEILPL